MSSAVVMLQGVSKLVGEAVGTRRTFTQTIPTVGVATWGTIRDRDQLVNDTCQVKNSSLIYQTSAEQYPFNRFDLFWFVIWLGYSDLKL